MLRIFKSSSLKTFFTGLGFGLVMLCALNVISPSKAAADIGCGSPSGAWQFNANVAVRVIEADGHIRWSDNFTFRVNSADPEPWGPGQWPIDERGINWHGRPGYPTDQATFNAVRGQTSTEQCPTMTPSDLDATTFIFGDGTSTDKAFLSCNWGQANNSPEPHGLAFAFTALSVNDLAPGQTGTWENAFYMEPGGLNDANDQTAPIVFVFRVTPPDNIPNFDFAIDWHNCDLISGWAYYSPLGVNPVSVSVFVDGGPGQPGVIGWSFDANQPSPDVTAYKGYPGDHRFGFSPRGDPRGVDFNVAHTLNFYAGNVPGSPLFASRTMPACPSQTATTVGYPTVVEDSLENPNNITFQAYITQSTAYAVDVTRKFYIVRIGTTTESSILPDITYASTGNTNYPDVPITGAQNSPYNLRVGDQICTSLTIDRTPATIDYGGAVSGSITNTVFRDCRRMVNQPYLALYGGDVSAGGDFEGGNCNLSAGITTNNNSSGLGSGVEFAAQALGTISGFSSSRLVSPPRYLAFSNTTPTLGNFASPFCIPNYFANAAPLTADTSSSRVDFNRSGSFLYRRSTIRMGGVNLSNPNRAAIYIDGDLIIDGDINYANPSWTTLAEMPSLHVYVRGNIFIQSNVSRLTGFFVAQPSSAPSSGRIVTCTDASGVAIAPNNLFSLCGTRLQVNGGLVGNKVNLLRAANSMRNGTAASEVSANTSNGAEVIDLTPESLMTAPNSIGNTTRDEYQFYTSLPPVL